jgi:hypothetical protein
MTVPCRWDEGGLRGFTGRARFRRRFGYPGRIDEYERVWLVFAGFDGTAKVALNGRFLGEQRGANEPFEYEVTSLLQQRNELAVEVESSTSPGGLWGDVALEVRCTAYLRGVRIWADPSKDPARLHLAGELIGTCERPLELYMLLDRSTVLYSTLEAVPEGRTFECNTETLTLGSTREHEVRVELVNGAVVWYAIDQTLEIAR